MRITRGMMFNNFLSALGRLERRTARSQEQVSAGHKVLRPSDDPAAAARINGIAAQLARLDRVDRSAQAGRTVSLLIDSSLGEITNSLSRVRELAVRGGSFDSGGAREELALEVEALRDQILSAIAVQQDGRYLTSGTQTDLPPFDAAGNYQGNTSALTAEVAEGERINVAPTGADALQGTVDVPARLTALAAELRSGDLDAVRVAIGDLDAAIDHVSAVRARLGAAIIRIDAGLQHRLNVRESLGAEASDLARAGLPEILVDLAEASQAREATLAVGARIGGPSLFDFLR